MSFKVFISHSVSPRELAVVYALAEEAAKQGIEPFIPDRGWSPHVPIPSRVLVELQASDAMVVVATKFGTHHHHVSYEMNSFDKTKPFLLLQDPEVSLNVTQPVSRIQINRFDLTGTILQASQELKSLKLAKAAKDALTWLVVGGVLLMLFQENQ